MMKYVFRYWSDGVPDHVRSVNLDSDISLNAIYGTGEVKTLEITGRKEGCIVNPTTIEVPEARTINLAAEKSWTGSAWEITVTATYADDGSPAEGVEILADGVSKGTTGTDGRVSFTWP